jgi:hypothetical protein
MALGFLQKKEQNSAMNLTIIKQQLLELSRADQLELNAFLQDVTNPVDPQAESAVLEMVAQRAERLRAGESQGIELEDVMNELKSRL